MAISTDEQTKVQSKSPPPQDPPDNSDRTDSTTPNPSDLFGTSARVTSPAQAIVNRNLADITDQELLDAFKDNPKYVLRRLTIEPTQAQRLKNIPNLQKLLNQTVATFTPRDLGSLPPDELHDLEKTLNSLRGEIYSKWQKGKSSAENFEGLLTLYRGRLANFMLSQASQSLIFSALGPVGSMLSSMEHKKMSRETAWQKNLLNAESVNYYLHSLPEQQAFKLIFNPVKKTVDILARSQNPLFSVLHYIENGKAQTRYGFTPYLLYTQAAEKIGDSLERLTGDRNKSGRVIFTQEQTYKDLNNLLTKLNNPNISSELKKQTEQRLKKVLAFYDGRGSTGFKGLLKNSLLHPLKRFSQNIKRTENDPLSYLAILIGNLLFDVTAGMVLNTIRYLATRIISQVPFFVKSRASLLRLFNAPNFGTMASQTLSAFSKGVFSFNTLAGSYLGYQLGGAPLATIFGAQAALYKTILNLSQAQIRQSTGVFTINRVNYIDWLNKNPAVSEGGLLGKGPITQAANAFRQKGWFRIPLNGLAIGVYLAPAITQYTGSAFWGNVLSIGVSGLLDYLWQTKGWWSTELFKRFFVNKLGVNFLRQMSLKAFRSPDFYRNLLNNASREVLFKTFGQSLFETTGRTLLFQKNALGQFLRNGLRFLNNPTVRNFLQNWLANPGFFIGLTLSPLLAGFLGIGTIPALILAPLISATVWNVGSIVLSNLLKMSLQVFNQLAWYGWAIGSIAQLIFPGLSPWFSVITAFSFPIIVQIGIKLGGFLANSAIRWLASIGAGMTGLFSSLSTGILGISITMSGIAVGSLVISGIFAAVIIFTAFQAGSLGPTSQCFNLEVSTPTTSLNKNQLVPVSVNIGITEDPLLLPVGIFSSLASNSYSFTSAYDKNNYQLIEPPAISSTRENPDGTTTSLTKIGDNSAVDRLSNPNTFDVSITSFGSAAGIEILTVGFAMFGPKSYFELAEEFPALEAQATEYLGYFKRLFLNSDQAQENISYEFTQQLVFLKAQVDHLETIKEQLEKGYEPQNIQLTIGLVQSSLAQTPEITLPTCESEDIECLEHLQKLQLLQLSWDQAFSTYLSDLNSLQRLVIKMENVRNDPNSAIFVAAQNDVKNEHIVLVFAIENYISSLDAQIQGIDDSKLSDKLPNVIEELIDLDNKFTETDFSNLSDKTIALLVSTFSQFEKQYYYLPGGTIFHLNYTLKYLGESGQPTSITGMVELQNLACRANDTALLNPLGSAVLQWPYKTPPVPGISSCYGDVRTSASGGTFRHTGLDLDGYTMTQSGPINNTPQIYPSAPGVVITANQSIDPTYGVYVVIDHLDGWYTLYAHMEIGSLKVVPGQTVSTDTPLGTEGNTGDVYPAPDPTNPTAGSHLHLGLAQGPSKTDFLSESATANACQRIQGCVCP